MQFPSKLSLVITHPSFFFPPQLQKSAVLQKTIDFIRHLEATIKRLHEENRQLKDMLAKATGQLRLAGYNQSPPVTPPSVSPRSSVSGEDSAVPPSSPDCDSVSFCLNVFICPASLSCSSNYRVVHCQPPTCPSSPPISSTPPSPPPPSHACSCAFFWWLCSF